MTPSSAPSDTFLPPPGLRNAHVQSVISSARPRRLKVQRMAAELIAASRDIVLDCGEGVRLLGYYTPAARARPRGLITLIHGWEGSGESNYVLSVSAQVYRAGYSVFRLNLRDHGPSHHLNKGLFNSTRLDEVLGAMEAIQAGLPHERNVLIGFSLGGNFSLRVGASAAGRHFALDRIIAVCPVVDPHATMENLEQGSRLYHDYFVYKWKRSLFRKVVHFPEYDFHQHMGRMKSLREMNRYFVPNYTAYADIDTYFDAYAIVGDRLHTLAVPTYLITSADDPIVPARDVGRIEQPPLLEIEVTRYGGHCGFIENLRMDSWLDRHIIQLLDSDG